MAFEVQTIIDGHRNVVVKVTGIDTDTGIAVDVSALAPSCTRVNIDRLWFVCASGQTAQIMWDATVDVLAVGLAGNSEDMDFTKFGGLTNNAGAGVTGDIQVNGVGVGNFTIILHCSKHGIIDPEL